MADEKTITLKYTATKGGASITTGTLTDTWNMGGADMATGTQAVGTSVEVATIPADISYPADVIVKNLDSTNFVNVYTDSGGTSQCSKLLPGTLCYLAGISAIPYLKADTASCQVQWFAFEA
jgi:hypothetical protein